MEKKNELKELHVLPTVDNTKLPEGIRERIVKLANMQPYKITKKVKITYTKNQFLIRIPKEIAEEMNITASNSIMFSYTKPLPDSKEKPKLEITLI